MINKHSAAQIKTITVIKVQANDFEQWVQVETFRPSSCFFSKSRDCNQLLKTINKPLNRFPTSYKLRPKLFIFFFRDYNNSYYNRTELIVKTSLLTYISDIKMQTTSPEESPWSVNTQPNDWLITRVLKAWDQMGSLPLKAERLQCFLDQLSAYSQSNLNENLLCKQVCIHLQFY